MIHYFSPVPDPKRNAISGLRSCVPLDKSPHLSGFLFPPLQGLNMEDAFHL